jgi:hypothetical protein
MLNTSILRPSTTRRTVLSTTSWSVLRSSLPEALAELEARKADNQIARHAGRSTARKARRDGDDEAASRSDSGTGNALSSRRTAKGAGLHDELRVDAPRPAPRLLLTSCNDMLAIVERYQSTATAVIAAFENWWDKYRSHRNRGTARGGGSNAEGFMAPWLCGFPPPLGGSLSRGVLKPCRRPNGPPSVLTWRGA